MRIVARVGPLDDADCRNVAFEVFHGGDVTEAASYEAGTLYLRAVDAEAILRRLEGASGGFVGELEVRHVPPPL